jgi:hypothetical protein
MCSYMTAQEVLNRIAPELLYGAGPSSTSGRRRKTENRIQNSDAATLN